MYTFHREASSMPIKGNKTAPASPAGDAAKGADFANLVKPVALGKGATVLQCCLPRSSVDARDALLDDDGQLC
jgi:hypothetical protein